MNSILSLWKPVGCTFILGAVLLLSSSSIAALPPLSDAKLTKGSDVVITGEVVAEYFRIVSIEDSKGMTDRQWVLVVKVDSVRKGEIKVGHLVYLHGWNPEKRPVGFTGAGGHRWVPSPGQRGLFYLEQWTNGKLLILDPNGASTLPGE